jgi:hypothetical protein
MAYSAGAGAAARSNTQVEARTGGTGWWSANALLSTPTDWWTLVIDA